MKFLLDTCCISELVKKKPDINVIHWFEGQSEPDLFISVFTIGEISRGIQKLDLSKRREQLELWLNNDLLDRFRNRVLDFTIEDAIIWSKISSATEKVGKKIPTIDALIACSAISHNMAVVTRNEKDMNMTGVEIVNPWIPST